MCEAQHDCNLELLFPKWYGRIRKVEAVANDQLTLAGVTDDKNVKKSTWTKIKEYRKDVADQGGLLLKCQAQEILAVSSQRMSQLTQSGRLDEYVHFGKTFVSAEQVIEWARVKRVGGDKGQKLANGWEATKAEMKADISNWVETSKKSIKTP